MEEDASDETFRRRFRKKKNTFSNRQFYRIIKSAAAVLSDWIQEYFVKVHECPSEYMVNGYLDGI